MQYAMSLIKYIPLLILCAVFAMPSDTFAATYFIDFTNGSDANTGLGTTSALAFRTLNQFANNARAAGDVAFIRRGTASTTYVVATTFTTDGTLNSPITVSADYDALWPTDFATSSQTYTPVFGALTMEANTTITGISAGTARPQVARWCWPTHGRPGPAPCAMVRLPSPGAQRTCAAGSASCRPARRARAR